MLKDKFDEVRGKLLSQIEGFRSEADAILTDETRDYDAQAAETVKEKRDAIAKIQARVEDLDKVGFEPDRAEVEEERSWTNHPAVIRSRGRKSETDITTHAAREGYSVTRAINCVLSRDRLSGVEAEVDQEIARNQKRTGDFLMPYGDIERLNTRTLNTSTGVGAIPTYWDGSMFVDFLYPMMVGPQLGWNYLDKLMSGTKLPRQSSVPTVQAVAESGSATESDPGLDDVTFLPHTVTANVTYSRRFGYQSIVGADKYINKTLAAQTARKIESGVITGAGGNDVTGLLNLSGLSASEILSSNTLAYSNVISMKKKIALANANFGDKTRWLTGPSGYARGVTTPKIGSTFPVFVIDDEGRINGELVASTSQVPENLTYSGSSSLTALIYGNHDFIYVGFFGNGLDVIVDPFSGSVAGDVTITALMDYDFQCVHPAAFCVAPNLAI